jgi:hypothetical protein
MLRALHWWERIAGVTAAFLKVCSVKFRKLGTQKQIFNITIRAGQLF